MISSSKLPADPQLGDQLSLMMVMDLGEDPSSSVVSSPPHTTSHSRFKERFSEFCVQLVEIMCVWDCCGCYIKLAEFLSFIVFDPFVDLFITLCIVINTAFMALDHHDMDPTMTSTLKNGNYVRDFF